MKIKLQWYLQEHVILNINLFKQVLADAAKWQAEDAEVEFAVVGSKATSFFNNMGAKVASQISGLGDRPSVTDLIGSVRVMLDAYDNGEIDRLFVVYNKFVNTMTQKPTIDQPLKGEVASHRYHIAVSHAVIGRDILDAIDQRVLNV